jgi:hypothetical protein
LKSRQDVKESGILPPFTFGELFGIFGKTESIEILTCMYFLY